MNKTFAVSHCICFSENKGQSLMVEVTAQTLEQPSSYLDFEENCNIGLCSAHFLDLWCMLISFTLDLAKKLYYEKKEDANPWTVLFSVWIWLSCNIQTSLGPNFPVYFVKGLQTQQSLTTSEDAQRSSCLLCLGPVFLIIYDHKSKTHSLCK